MLGGLLPQAQDASGLNPSSQLVIGYHYSQEPPPSCPSIHSGAPSLPSAPTNFQSLSNCRAFSKWRTSLNFPHRIFTNLKTADWDSQTPEAEASFVLLGLPSSCSTGEPLFRKNPYTSANSKSHHHSIHPSIRTIERPSSSHSEQHNTIPGENFLYTGSDLRSSLQIQYPSRIFSHPDLTQYQHPEVPCWYQLGSMKGNYTHHLYVPYPVSFRVCNSHLVPQLLTVPYSETPSYRKPFPLHSERLNLYRSLARGN